MRTAKAGDGSEGTDIGQTFLAQLRTFRIIAQDAREMARAVLQGDELGLAVLPYTILALERAIDLRFRHEESLLLPLLELELPDGLGTAEDLRTRHAFGRGEIASLSRGGPQQAVVVARRLHALTSTLLADVLEQEKIWRLFDGDRRAMV